MPWDYTSRRNMVRLSTMRYVQIHTLVLPAEGFKPKAAFFPAVSLDPEYLKPVAIDELLGLEVWGGPCSDFQTVFNRNSTRTIVHLLLPIAFLPEQVARFEQKSNQPADSIIRLLRSKMTKARSKLINRDVREIRNGFLAVDETIIPAFENDHGSETDQSPTERLLTCGFSDYLCLKSTESETPPPRPFQSVLIDLSQTDQLSENLNHILTPNCFETYQEAFGTISA